METPIICKYYKHTISIPILFQDFIFSCKPFILLRLHITEKNTYTIGWFQADVMLLIIIMVAEVDLLVLTS